MAKVAKKAPAKVNVDLNRWCIEMAMRWPMVHVPATYNHAVAGLPGGGVGYQQSLPARDVDADVVGRAAKIMEWIKTAH